MPFWNNKKVYCGKCRWYQQAGQGDEYQKEACMAIIDYISSYSNKSIPKRILVHPQDLNKDNNCTRCSWNWFGWRGY